MFRIAAFGDLHLRGTVPTTLVREIKAIHQRADVLVVTGDITNGGRIVEVELAAELFRLVQLPIIAVLGNHDRRSLRMRAFKQTLALSGVTVLDGTTLVLDRGLRIGFAGVGGSGGGFWPDEGPDTLSRRACQALAVRARREAARLDAALGGLQADVKVVVTHFAPTSSTLGREPVVKYPLLGNSELGKVIDRHDVDLVLHGHAHLGNAIGRTAGGTLVRNVAVEVCGGIVVHELVPRAYRAAARPAWRSIEARM
jgi:Icc-related predicted phosphoesterase